VQEEALKRENCELQAASAAAATGAAEAAARLKDLSSRLEAAEGRAEAAEKAAEKLRQQVKRLEREKGELPTSEALVRKLYTPSTSTSTQLQPFVPHPLHNVWLGCVTRDPFMLGLSAAGGMAA